MAPSSSKPSRPASSSSSSRQAAGASASPAPGQQILSKYFAKAPSASTQHPQHQQQIQNQPPPSRSSSPLEVAATSAKAAAPGPSQNVHLAALGRGFASTQSPSASLFKWAPDQGQSISNGNASATARPPRASIDEDEEERRWLERAQRLSTKSKGSDDSTSSAAPSTSAPRARASSASSDSILSPPRVAKRLCVEHGDTSPTDASHESPEPPSASHTPNSAASRTPESAKRLTTGVTAASPTSPIQETPFMHEPEYSQLAWETDAARKAPQYRISAGLQPTAQDIAASRQVDRDAAEKARREAIARSFGAPVPAAQHPVRGDQQARETHAWPPPRPSSTKDPHHRPATPLVHGLATSGQRKPLSPRRYPNAASGSRASGSKPPNPPVDKRVFIQDDEEGDSGEESPLRAGPSPPRPTRFSSSQTGTRRLFTPAAPLAAIRSPRTNRRVYALETQDGNPLPSPLVACRLFGPHSNRPGPSTARPRPPTGAGPSAKAKGKASEESSSLSSPPSRLGSQLEERSPLRDIDTPSPSSSPPTPHHRGGYVPDETYREPDPPSDIPETPARSQPPRTAKSMAKSQSTTTKRGPLGQALGARLDSAKAAAQKPVVARRQTQDSGGNSSSSLSSPPPLEVETQKLDSDYDDDDDEDVLETKAGKVQRSEGGGNAGRGGDREATQPLPFPPEEEESSEEEMLGHRPPPRRKTRKSSRRTAAAVPPALTRWPTVNDAWAGIRQDERARASGSPASRQQTLGRFGFDETTRVPSTQRGEGSSREGSTPAARRPLSAAERAVFEEHPLPRDQTDELSDGEDADGEEDEEGGHRSGLLGHRRKHSDLAIGKGRDAADDSGFVDAANSPLPPARRPQQQQKRPLPSPTRNWTAIDAADDDSDGGETQPLGWGPSSSQSSHTEDESPPAPAIAAPARSSPKKRQRLDATEIRRATSHVAAGASRATGGGVGGGGSEKTPSSSQTSASSSTSWVPDPPKEGAPQAFGSFFGRL